jgi:hypothetical protein
VTTKKRRTRWTAEKDQQLLDMLDAEASWPLIAIILKRSIQAAQERARKLKGEGVELGAEGEEVNARPPPRNQWFRNRNNQFPPYVGNPTHRSRLSKRSTEPDFNRHPEKTDRY